MSHLEVPPHETCLHEADCCSYSERSLWAEGPLGEDALPGNTPLKDGRDCTAAGSKYSAGLPGLSGWEGLFLSGLVCKRSIQISGARLAFW